MKFIGIIPARYASTRFPAKPLAILGGKPVIQRVYEQVAGILDEAYVATDDERIEAAVKAFGGKVVMTSVNHKSGTDRCYEAFTKVAAAAARSLKNAQLPARWVSEAAVRALSRGASPEKYKKLWALLKSLRSVKDFDLFARQFNKAQKSFVLALFPAAAYLAETGQGSGNHPLLGMYDRKAQREIFGERTISWEIICRSGNTKENLSGNSPDVTWEAEFDRNKSHSRAT